MMTLCQTPGVQPASETVDCIQLGSVPLLFVDDAGIRDRSGVSRTVYAAVTLDHPVIEPDRAWEGGRLYIYGSVYADPSGGLTMWYQSCSTLEQGSDHVLYATSRDGLVWDKPSMGVTPFNGSTENNIVFDLHSPSILLDRFEADPARRYKMLGAQKGKSHKGYDAAFSPDGIHWTYAANNPVLSSSDTITLSQNCVTGEYLAYHKRPTNIRGFKRRVVLLSRSPDFEKWSEPELVLAPDEEDDAWVQHAQERTEIYNMSVFAHAGGFVGLPTMFRVLNEIPRKEAAAGQSPLDGPIDVQLVTSTDGVTWRRTWPRVNVIPRGSPGAFDAGAILGVSSTAVDIGESTCVYYTAINTGHGATIPPKRLTVGLACWRRHGFVSLDADASGGQIETKLVQLRRPVLRINADASRGSLRLALREADGTPIEGFDFDQSATLTADNTQWNATWTTQKPIPTGRPVRVVIRLTDARLFSISSDDSQ